jgi:hypothetical protein
MSAAVEIAIALFVVFAVFAALRGNWAGALAAAGVLVLGVMAALSGERDDRYDCWLARRV